MKRTVNAPMEEALPPKSSTTEVGCHSSASMNAAMQSSPRDMHLHAQV